MSLRRRDKRTITTVEVPRSMAELANRRGSEHITKWRSLEENMGAAYLQGFHDALIASGYLPNDEPKP